MKSRPKGFQTESFTGIQWNAIQSKVKKNILAYFHVTSFDYNLEHCLLYKF